MLLGMLLGRMAYLTYYLERTSSCQTPLTPSFGLLKRDVSSVGAGCRRWSMVPRTGGLGLEGKDKAAVQATWALAAPREHSSSVEYPKVGSV